MRTLTERTELEACDLSIGMEVVYGEEYKDSWNTAFLEGRVDYEDFINIVKWKGLLVGLTTQGGVVTVQSPVHAIEFRSFKTVHVDNLASPKYLED